jgi:hypothetical protein
LSASGLALALMLLSGKRRHAAEFPSVSVASPPERRSKRALWNEIASWIGVGVAVLALIQAHDQTPVVITETSIASPSPTPLRTASDHHSIFRPEHMGTNPELGTGDRTAQEDGRAAAHKMSTKTMMPPIIGIIMIEHVA